MSKKNKSNKICILIPYFGKWPAYFNIFLKSCEYNSQIVDYIFFTDISNPKKHPKNVRFVEFTINDFNEIASRKLALKVNINHPYKLCDFKPAYGFIFSEYLKDYLYWGHGDEDLLLGDLQKFLKDGLEDLKDVLSVRKEWISGSFCIFKNSKNINEIFRKSEIYPEVYLTNQYMAFDECSSLFSELREDASILDIDQNQSMTYLIKKAEKEKLINVQFETTIKESINEGDYLLYDQGKILLNGEREFIAYHYITEKKTFQFSYPKWESVPDTFYIDNSGFYTENEWGDVRLRMKIRKQRKFHGMLKKGKYYLRRIKEKIFS